MDRYFLFLVVHDDDPATQKEHCQCRKDGIPGLQSLIKDLIAYCDDNENSSTDHENAQLMLFDPLLALKNWTPTIHFSVVEDKPFSNQFECYSRWHTGEYLKEVLCLFEKPVSPRNLDPVELSSDSGVEISERLHQLADGLPDQGVPVDVFWFICGRSNVPIRSHLHLFGALKRLQQWHNANITVLCSNEFDRSSFVKSWQKGLKFSISQLNQNNITTKLFNPSVVWQGSVVFGEGQTRTELPGFNLCFEKSNKKMEPSFSSSQCQEKRNKKSLHIAPEITILCKVQKHTVPFHMFLPVRLTLTLDCSSTKLSTRLIEWLSFEKNKTVALIGSLQLVAPWKHSLKRKNKEAWFDFVKSEDHSAANKMDSRAGEGDSESCRRACLICGNTEKELSVYVLRAPEHLNGWIQHQLSSIHSSLLISNDQEAGGPFRFPDLTDSFLETEQNLTKVLLLKLQQELKTSGDLLSADLTTDIVDQIISEKWKFLREIREKLFRDGKTHQLEVVKRAVLLQGVSELPMSPSKWPERAWLIRTDPNARDKDSTVEDTDRQFPLLASETQRPSVRKVVRKTRDLSSLSIQDILEKFRMDGTPTRSDLVPIQPREESLRGKLIQISADDVKGKGYPEALATLYHGIEYCLDVREAISKDLQLSQLQSSHVKLETLSSCVERDRKPLASRCTQAATKASKNDRKQSLMKLSVPLTKTEQAGKGGKPVSVTGRSLKRKSPVTKKPTMAMKRKRQEPDVQESKPDETDEDKSRETRSERHKRRLRQVVQKTLEDNGIDSNHSFYEPCTERLYSLCKSFLKDLRSSHGLNEEMKRLAKSIVQQVIEFEAKRRSEEKDT